MGKLDWLYEYDGKDNLTKRQKEILQYYLDYATLDPIARKLDISPNSVRVQFYHIRRKRSEAILLHNRLLSYCKRIGPKRATILIPTQRILTKMDKE